MNLQGNTARKTTDPSETAKVIVSNSRDNLVLNSNIFDGKEIQKNKYSMHYLIHFQLQNKFIDFSLYLIIRFCLSIYYTEGYSLCFHR